MTDIDQDNICRWKRLVFEETPIYVDPEKPDWVVPGPLADEILRNKSSWETNPFKYKVLLDQIEDPKVQTYNGRASHLSLNGIKECWFHLTNKCNLACKHCLFSSSPKEVEEISPKLLREGIREAKEMGSNLFYFTGGEPFVYPHFTELVSEILSDHDIHVVILTNGLLLEEHIDSLSKIDRERLHLQISLDGLEKHHDQLRGTNSFAKLMSILDILRERNIPATLSVAVNKVNYKDLSAITLLAVEKKISNLHFLWHFVRGKGSRKQFVDPAHIFPELIKAQKIAESHGIKIDNIENLRSQVFSSPGTKFDMSNAGWESLAIGPEGDIYPSPALVGIPALTCGNLTSGLAEVWRNSPVLKAVREATVLNSAYTSQRPLRMITGGDDIDHSFMNGGEFTGHDPYITLYESIALWLIKNRSEKYPPQQPAEIMLRMGDVRHDCPDGGQDVSLTHCNCVISLAGTSGHHSVREFYAQAAQATNKEIVNPFITAKSTLDFIPIESKNRSYGCGSPIHDALPRPGETIVDLGSGSGVECFLASAAVGKSGKVVGVDMTREMLELAEKSKQTVVEELGYDNLTFNFGFLEDIPLPDNDADAIISNCVINLSPDKRGTLHEAYRVLKPGGRLVVSDIVTDEQVPVTIKNNEKFRGECLGGALQQVHLLAMLNAVGFKAAKLIKRFPYRKVGSTQFYSLTFSCVKPYPAEDVDVIYRGSLEGVSLSDGTYLPKGKKVPVKADVASEIGEEFFILDDTGRVVNIPGDDPCCGQNITNQLQALPTFSENNEAADGCCGSESKVK